MKFLKFLDHLQYWGVQALRLLAVLQLCSYAWAWWHGQAISPNEWKLVFPILVLSNLLIPYLRRDLRRAGSRS